MTEKLTTSAGSPVADNRNSLSAGPRRPALKRIDMLPRFSTVAGDMGAADAERDVRRFALKFYTEEGDWDLVGNDTPVFFVSDPLKFRDFIHTQKRHFGEPFETVLR